MSLDRRSEAGAGRNGLAMHDDAAPVEQRTPDFERGCVESERRRVQHPRAVIERNVVYVAYEANNRAMQDFHTLRGTGRS